MCGQNDKTWLVPPLPSHPAQLMKPDTRQLYQHIVLPSKSSSPPRKIETLFTVTEKVAMSPTREGDEISYVLGSFGAIERCR